MHKLLTVAVFLVCASVMASQSAAPARQPYIFFSNLDRGETEQKINEFAADGYRLAGLQESLTGLLIVAMEDVTPIEGVRYEYKLLAGHWQRYLRDKQPLAANISTAGAQGFRCVPGSFLSMLPEAWVAHPNEHALAMERVRGSRTTYEYRLSHAMVAKNSMSDLQAAMHDGFAPVATYSFQGEREILLEKSSNGSPLFDPGPATTARTARTLQGIVWPNLSESTRHNGLEIVNLIPKRLDQKIAERVNGGKHLLVLSSGAMEIFGMIWADIPSAPPQKILTGEFKYRRDDLRSLRSAGWDKMSEALNAAAADGYSVSLRPMFVTRSNFAISEFTFHYVIPMEQQTGAPSRQYRIVRADSLPELSQAVNQAAAEGWTLVPGLLYGDSVVFLQKQLPEVQP